MDDTRYQFPSVTVSRRYNPDASPELIARYDGEARKLLYELKNLMSFQKLGQLKMTRFFMDGTVITAWSIFGQDFIHIDTSRSVWAELVVPIGECTITLFNLPDVVQPMRYPGEIRPDEVEGIDYIKTYYTVDFSKCHECILKWNMLRGQTGNFTNTEVYKLLNPFVFFNPTIPLWWDIKDGREKRYAQNPRPDDHCLYSLWGNCAAEIIEYGQDEGGTYIKWKAYTEWTYNFEHRSRYGNIQSRTGFGYAEIMPYSGERIIKPDGTVGFAKEDCSAKGLVIVDCCKKEPDIRNVELWDEATFSDREGGFLLYGNLKLYKTPPVVQYRPLYNYIKFGSGSFWVLPEIKGGCIPFQWSVTGAVKILIQSEYGSSISLALEDPHKYPLCTDNTVITVQDRCGTKDEVVALSCCESADPLAIVYTSLQMSCGSYQYLYAEGGCSPYTWSLSGGGTIVPITPYGREAVYTAPSSNPNCSLNPTITLADCCGGNTSISLAVNCYTGNIRAFRHAYYHPINCRICPPPREDTRIHDGVYAGLWDYRCDGTILCQGHWIIGPRDHCVNSPACWSPVFPCCHPNCYTHISYGWDSGCGDCYMGGQCFGEAVDDTRSEIDKQLGCCPINPLTGLPF